MGDECRTILVVDDSQENRQMLELDLRLQGHCVVTAEDGRQALERLREQRCDLVLLDILMPEMDGYQVLEQLKADPGLRHIPVIVISGADEIKNIAKCIELGAEDFMPKPIEWSLLQARIGSSLEKKRLHDQEQASKQALEEAIQAKDEFSSSVAHELRNFVTPVSGYLDLLRQEFAGQVPAEMAHMLDIVRTNVERIKTLLADLIDISRLEGHRLHLDLAAVSLGEAVEEIRLATYWGIQAKGQRLSVDIPGDLPPLWTDRMRLVQVLMNLVSNAHKYTPEGGTIRVWAERQVGPSLTVSARPTVHVAVQDNGIGIGAEEQGRIFEEFFRSSDEQARSVPGIGLGLHIAKCLIEMQGGRMWFESELRRGTTFHFTLPGALP